MKAGDRALALKKLSEGDLWRALAKEARLTAGQYLPKITEKAMTDAHREAISKGRLKGRGRSNPNLVAAREIGLNTVVDLAKALDNMNPSLLSRVLSGDKQMPPLRARKFKELTGKDWV